MIRFQDGGWWLPDGEEHLQMCMNTSNHREAINEDSRLTYQYHKYVAAIPFVRERRRAIDIGAHVGLWSWVLSRDFERVECFEPLTVHRECWKRNMVNCEYAVLWPFALGNVTGNVRVRSRTPGSSGDTGVDPVSEQPSLRTPINTFGERVAIRRLDSFQFEEVDFIKIDCEGYELFVLQGAVETLKRCKPCLIVEQKPETGMKDRYGVTAEDCITFLVGLGAKKRLGIQGDYIFSWD